MALKARQVENAKPRDKVHYMSDGQGLRLKVDPKGRKGWELRTRFGKGNARKAISVWLGSFPEVSLADARQKKSDVFEQIENGEDPRIVKKVARQTKLTREASATLGLEDAKTFRYFAEKWMAKRSSNWTADYMSATKGRFTNHIYKPIGDLCMGDINSAMVISLLEKFEGIDRTNSNLCTRDKVLEQIGAVFMYAKAIDETVTNNAAEFDRRTALQQREGDALEPQNFVALEWKLIGKFWHDLDHWAGTGGFQQGLNPLTRMLTKLQILTLSRPGEIRLAKWAEIDFDECLWTVPKERMKARRKNKEDHLVPLSRQAIAILRELQKLTGDCVHLFPKILGRSSSGDKFDDSRTISDGAVRLACKRMGYAVHAHGFRHMASSYLHSLETEDERGMWDSLWIEYALSHVDPNRIRGIYNNSKYLKARRRMLQYFADQISPTPQLTLVEKSA